MQRAHRLRRRADFTRVLRTGTRVARPEFVLHYAARAEPGPPRVGLSVGRAVGSAVVRNRVRRLLREAVRPLIARLDGCDLVLSARPPIKHVDLDDLASAISDSARDAGLILSDT